MCRTGCPTQDHASWCKHAGPIRMHAYYADLFSASKWRCNECEEVLPLASFYLRSSTGRPISPLCKNHFNQHGKKAKVRRYGISHEEYQEQVARQSGLCLICGQPPTDGVLRIDHDHSCCSASLTSCGNCIRGLLCNNCNVGLGFFANSPEKLRKAAEYLEHYTG